jgi:DNA polymerase-4
VRERVERFQQVGIDEAYLDVTGFDRPMPMLRELIAEIEERTGMVLSVGVGPSKLVAKTISASFKPRALKALSREQACEHFASESTRILQGVGPVTADRLAALGARTVGDLQHFDETALIEAFGENHGRFLKQRAWFHGSAIVAAPGPAKSRSNETTFPEDVADHAELEATLAKLTDDLCAQLQRKEVRGRNVAIKVRLDDWTTVTRARTIEQHTNDTGVVTDVALDLLRAYAPPRPVRLLGVRLAAFEDLEADPAPQPPADQLALPVSVEG